MIWNGWHINFTLLFSHSRLVVFFCLKNIYTHTLFLLSSNKLEVFTILSGLVSCSEILALVVLMRSQLKLSGIPLVIKVELVEARCKWGGRSDNWRTRCGHWSICSSSCTRSSATNHHATILAYYPLGQIVHCLWRDTRSYWAHTAYQRRQIGIRHAYLIDSALRRASRCLCRAHSHRLVGILVIFKFSDIIIFYN